MKQIDPTVLKETRYVSFWVIVFSALMQAVFLLIGRWNLTVLWGNLLSGALFVLNFFLMGLGVQKALAYEADEAKKVLKLSRTYRNLLLIVVLALGVTLPLFDTWAVLVPAVFVRIAIALRSFKKQS